MTKDTKVEIAQKEQQVEKMGIFFENMGYSPMASRVFALLLVAEPPYMDFYAIQDFMKASKSSISNALKILSNSGIVDYITFSGDRKRYFRVNTQKWFEIIKDREQQGKAMNDMLGEVLEMRKDTKHLTFNEDLQKIMEFQIYLNEGLKDLIKQWEEKYS